MATIRKRDYGDGAIQPRPSKQNPKIVKYQATIRLPDGRRLSKTEATKPKAQAWLRKQIELRDKGELIVAPKMRLDAYLAHWLTTIQPTVEAKTFQSYSSLVRTHLAPALGRYPLAELQPLVVQQFYADRLAAGLSRRTVNYIHAVLRRALNQAVRWGLVARNVTHAVDAPKPDKRQMKVFTADESRRFLSAIREHRLFALFLLAIVTGMRQGELLALNWEDVDFEHGVAHVRRSLVEVRGRAPYVKTTKTGRGRVVPIPLLALAALRAHWQRQQDERALLDWPPSSFVFLSEAGTPLYKGNFRGTWKRLIARAGVPDIRFHDLRHTAATLLLARRVHPKIVQETLGHSSVALTMDTYSHLLPHMGQDVADNMQEIFAGNWLTTGETPTDAAERG